MAVVAWAACAWAAPEDTVGGMTAPRTWTILAHLDARGGLDEAALTYERRLSAAAASGGYGLAVQAVARPGEVTTVRRQRLAVTGHLEASAAPMASSPAQALADFVEWGASVAPARHYALLVMGHGAGLLQAPNLPADALTPAVLREGLETACDHLGQPLDVVGLDTCYGGTVEVAYGLRKCCRYLTAAAGLIYSPGLDWAGALGDMGGRPEANTLVRRLVQRGMAERPDPLVLVAVDTRQLEPVCWQVRRLKRAVLADLKQELPVLTYARSHCQSWGERGELADLGELAAALAANGLDSDVRKAASELCSGLDSLTLCRWRSAAVTGASNSGIGVYLPPTFEPVPPDYLRAFEFASSSEWGALLESYWMRLADSLSGATTR